MIHHHIRPECIADELREAARTVRELDELLNRICMSSADGGLADRLNTIPGLPHIEPALAEALLAEADRVDGTASPLGLAPQHVRVTEDAGG